MTNLVHLEGIEKKRICHPNYSHALRAALFFLAHWAVVTVNGVVRRKQLRLIGIALKDGPSQIVIGRFMRTRNRKVKVKTHC